MPKSQAQKAETVQALGTLLQSTETIVAFTSNKLTVAEDMDWRRKLQAAGGQGKLPKNTLMKLALKGTRFEGLTPLFKGPTTIAMSQDPVAAAKVIYEFAKGNDKVKILGGAMGDKVLSVSEVEALAKLPSLDELRGKIVGVLQAPAAKIARIMQAPAQAMIGVTAAQGRKA